MRRLNERGGIVCVVFWVLAVLVVAAVLTGPAAAETLSLTLDEAVAIALEHGHELGLTRAAEDAARAQFWQARSAFLPAVSASASYTKLDEIPYMDGSQFGNMFAPLMVPFEYLVEQGYLDPSTLEGLSGSGGSDKIYMGDDDIYSVGVTVTQPIFMGGALWSAKDAVGHGMRAAEYNTDRAEHQTRYNATEAYVMLVQAAAALEVMDGAVEQMRSHLDDLEAMYEEGMVLERDIMQARVQMSSVELDRSSVRNAVSLSEAGLAFQLGLTPGTSIEAADDLDGVSGFSRPLDGLVDRALTGRPDLLAMRESVGAADNMVGVARAEFLPSVVAVGSYNWDRPNREYEPEFYDNWSLTLSASMNVFDWGGRWNRVREAKANRLQAERGLAMMEDAVRLEVEAGWSEHDAALEAVDIAARGVMQARESYRVTEESFKSGMASNSDVLDANTALRSAELDMVAALARLRMAEAGLDLATGCVGE